MNIYTVYDSKAKAYLTPFFIKNNAMALRAFTDTVNDPKSQFNRYPGDYTLFHLGEYDEDTAAINTFDTPQSLGVAVEFITDSNQQDLLDIQEA